MQQDDLLHTLSLNSSIVDIQSYLKVCLDLRGFSDQGPKEKMLLLTEEVGELAKALRKNDSESTIDYKRLDEYESVESEIADVFIVLVSLCNVLNVSLIDAFLKKEQLNVQREWN